MPASTKTGMNSAGMAARDAARKRPRSKAPVVATPMRSAAMTTKTAMKSAIMMPGSRPAANSFGIDCSAAAP